MTESDKVIKGLYQCKRFNKMDCDKCPYDYNGRGNGRSECIAKLASDALDVIHDLQSQIAMLATTQMRIRQLL